MGRAGTPASRWRVTEVCGVDLPKGAARPTSDINSISRLRDVHASGRFSPVRHYGCPSRCRGDPVTVLVAGDQ